jgi:molybdopterin molybdotransferase
LIVAAGTRIAAKHIGLLAACGCCQINVRQKLKVALISSGDELVDIQETPHVGQVRDVNSYSLTALLMEWGCEVLRLGIVQDSFERFFDQLTKASQTCHLVIISGGSSVGAKDFTVPAIQALGSPGLLMHGLAIKPGKPTIFGMAGKVPVFGLPGHPVAALMVCEQLVAKAVRKMLGMRPTPKTERIPAVLTRNIASVPGRDDFVTVRLIQRENGFEAEPILGKSGLISLITRADGVIHIPAEKSGLYQGEPVWVRLLGRKGE